jgi:putative ABC transport system permease protein
MLRNYLKTAWRNLVKGKTFSIINISGLALGMASSLLIMLWVNDETNIDKFNKQSSLLYSVYERQFYEGKTDAFHSTPGLMADELKRSFPEIEYASGFGWQTISVFGVGDKIIKETGSWAGADFFKMFDYPLLEGDAHTALNAPSAIAISRKMLSTKQYVMTTRGILKLRPYLRTLAARLPANLIISLIGTLTSMVTCG